VAADPVLPRFSGTPKLGSNYKENNWKNNDLAVHKSLAATSQISGGNAQTLVNDELHKEGV
jgi:hypothetical protein